MRASYFVLCTGEVVIFLEVKHFWALKPVYLLVPINFRACLGLFSSPASEVQKELNLIASLALLDDFQVSMLPVQVRLCENKLDIVRSVLDSSPTAYKKYDKVGSSGSP